MTPLLRALRAQHRHPWQNLTIVLALALGLALFHLATALAERIGASSLPGVDRPAELAVSADTWSWLDYTDVHAASADLPIAAWQQRTVAIGDGVTTTIAASGVASGNLFGVLGVAPQAGRLLGEDDDRVGAPPVVLLSAAYAAELGERGRVGARIRVNGGEATVVGVLPHDFQGLTLGATPRLWLPIQAWAQLRPAQYANLDLTSRNWGWLRLVLRSPLALEATAARFATTVARALPGGPSGARQTQLLSAEAAAVGARDRAGVVALATLLAGSALAVLVLAFANLAHLVLLRVLAREREFATKLALGAPRAALWREVTLELSLPVAAAIAFGLAVAVTLPARIAAVADLDVLPVDAATLLAPGRVLLSIGVALVGAALAAIGPLRHVLTTARTDGLRSSTGVAVLSGRRSGVLLASQIAASLVLLYGAALLGRAVLHAEASDTGMQLERIALAALEPGMVRQAPERTRADLVAIDALLAKEPGIERWTWAGEMPLVVGETEDTLDVEGYASTDGKPALAQSVRIGAGYFDTLGVRLVAGTAWQADAVGSGEAIVDRSFVAHYLGGRDPIGVHLRMFDRDARIVGVAPDLSLNGIHAAARPNVYLPLADALDAGAAGSLVLIAKARNDPVDALPLLTGAVRRADPDLPLRRAVIAADLYGMILLPQRIGRLLLAVLGAGGLLLAAIGLYGAIAALVALRAREIGLRLALGATPRDELSRQLRRGAATAGVGVLIGLPAALLLGRSLSALLYGLSGIDPIAAAVAAGFCLAVALAATRLAAQGVVRLDPVEALRS